jgi:hypothetical protein
VALLQPSRADPGKPMAEGSTGALIAIGNTAAVVGFGAVAKLSPAFAVASTGDPPAGRRPGRRRSRSA